MHKLKGPAPVFEADRPAHDNATGQIIHLENPNDTDNDCQIQGKSWPFVPDGIYQAIFLHHETGTAFNVPRVFLHFKIMTPGDYYGKILYRAYRVASISSKHRRGAAFKVNRNSDFVREMAIILDLSRLDRVSPQSLKNKILQVLVKVVTKDHRQREIPKVLRYSVIRELISVEVG